MGLTGITSKGDRIDIEIKGIDKVNQQIQVLIANDIRAGVQALREEAEKIMTASKRRVPVDNGILRSSGHVKVLDDFSLQLGYGGPAGSGNLDGETNTKDVGYALVVHEDLSASHPPKDATYKSSQPGEAKYLERPVLEALPGLAERVAKTMTQIRGGA